MTSLMIATTIPLLDNLYHILKEKQVDPFAMFMLVGFVLSILALFLGGDEKVLLLKESLVTGVMGLIFIGSLFFSKPLIYYFAIRFTTSGGSAEKSAFEKSWELPYFRFVMRLMTAVWGASLLAEAIIKTILVFRLSVSAFLVVSQLVFYGTIGLTIAWTVLYRKHAKKRIQRLKKQLA
ncbi:MAG: hypothetical protein F8N39_17855 [Clostridiaceae bacterium]|nr:hypothetical protein [Clostridiaceae bacterium]